MNPTFNIAIATWTIALVFFTHAWLTHNFIVMDDILLFQPIILCLSIYIFNKSAKPIRILHHIGVIPALLISSALISATYLAANFKQLHFLISWVGTFGPSWALFAINMLYIAFLVILAISYAIYRWRKA